MTGTDHDSRVRIHMSGSEWFDSRPGGLNRYFESLFTALNQRSDADTSATAFGDPISGGTSWGPTGQSLPSRLRATNRPLTLAPGAILDEHFALYSSAPPARNIARITHFHGPWADESGVAGAGGLATRAKRTLETMAYRRSDAFVVLSNTFRTALVDEYGVDDDRVHIIPGGVDVERFSVAEESSGPPTVVCARRLERRMGVHVLLDAWSDVLIKMPDAHLHIVGTGTYESELRSRADSLGLGESVRFEGRVSDDALRELYRASTITVVPSIALEGFGLISLESLATGRAPVVTDCGGLPDTVFGLDPSLIVPANDSDALAHRITLALDGARPSPAECRSHAEQFSWDRIAQQHMELYRSVLAQ